MRYDSPDYEWKAFFEGNPIQKWWKRSIAEAVWTLVGTPSCLLDVGCGSSPIISAFRNAVGIDTNAGKLVFMKEKCPNNSFIEASGDELPFANDSFDHVLCIEVIEHVDDPSAFFKEFNRVLKLGGVLIVATPNYGSITWLVIEKLYGVFMPGGYKIDHYNALNKAQIVRLGHTNGFLLGRTKMVALCDMVVEFTKAKPTRSVLSVGSR